MGIYIEALILYILLFFSGSTAFFAGTGEAAEFSKAAELLRITLYYIPSLALIWYLIFKAKKIPRFPLKFRLKKNDIVCGLVTLPCLLITGTGITFLSSYIGADANAAQITFYSPSTAPDWIVLCFTCIFSAYLEESYFRYYLLSKRKELNLNALSALALSVILFSICHLYAGLWGFLNAVICAAFLGFMFLRFNSLHGIAMAHALYNISAFILAGI